MNTAALIEQQLGIPGGYGAWWTGRRLLQECWKHKPSVIRDTTFDLRDLPFVDAARAILWRRDLEPYMVGWYVHLFDKNSQHLSACRGVNNGIGNPVHLTGDHRPGAPGIYRVTVNAIEDRGLMPPIIEADQEWVTNDVLLYAWQHGYDLTVHEAWVFWDYTKILDKWAEKLWNALQHFKMQPGPPSLMEANDEAYHKIKAISHVGPGSFATRKETHPGIDLIHPNWWADVVGKARVNLHCNLEKFGVPVCIRTDGLYYITRDPNPRTAVPGILDRMSQSGGYKIPAGWTSFQLTPEIYNQAIGLDHGALSSLFKKYGGLKDADE